MAEGNAEVSRRMLRILPLNLGVSETSDEAVVGKELAEDEAPPRVSPLSATPGSISAT